MRLFFLFSFLVLASAHPSIPKKEANNTDDEIDVPSFGKCRQKQYFDIDTAQCLDCTSCKLSEFTVSYCSKFKNHICSTCESDTYKDTPIYRINCENTQEDEFIFPYGPHNSTTSFIFPIDDTRSEIIANDHLPRLNESGGSDDINKETLWNVLSPDHDKNETNSAKASDNDNNDEEILPKIYSSTYDNDYSDDSDEEILPKLHSFTQDQTEISSGEEDGSDSSDNSEEKMLLKFPSFAQGRTEINFAEDNDSNEEAILEILSPEHDRNDTSFIEDNDSDDSDNSNEKIVSKILSSTHDKNETNSTEEDDSDSSDDSDEENLWEASLTHKKSKINSIEEDDSDSSDSSDDSDEEMVLKILSIDHDNDDNNRTLVTFQNSSYAHPLLNTGNQRLYFDFCVVVFVLNLRFFF
ncbi:hypothetical protein FO519_008922 [Halicephalobus sp. NKZ332]|nr:hypothetical protein FO519_008922 [Halicephalobus sp. NKZ332]